MTWLKKAVFHPVLFALYPVLALFVHNLNKLTFADVFGVIGIVLVLALLAWLLFATFTKDKRKSAIATSVFLFEFFSFGHISVTTSIFVIWAFGLGLNDALTVGRLSLLILMATIEVMIVYALKNTKSDLAILHQFLNIFAIILVVSVISNWVFTTFGQNRIRAFVDSWHNSVNAEAQQIDTGVGSRPDIYYIIVDSYAGTRVLQETYQTDNSEFLAFLRERGFYVAEKSRANYCQTTLSLASSLNYTHLQEVADQVGTETGSQKPLIAMAENSRLLARLQQYGYTFVSFASGYSGTEFKTADVYLAPPWNLDAFQSELVNTTPLPVLLELPFLDTQNDLHRERILYTLTHLGNVKSGDAPVFVLAHIVAPHAPFVFGPNGEPRQPGGQFALDDVTDSRYSKEEYIQGYRDQLAFVTKKLQETIEDLLSRSPEPPIIVLQADHGPRRSELDWLSFENPDLDEAFSILNAYYFPEQDHDALYPHITPVNTFRVVLNNYFGTSYPMLDDGSYYSSAERPYLFHSIQGQQQ